MTRAKADRDRNVEVGEHVEDDVFNEVRIGSGRDAVEHLAEDEAAYAFEFAGENEVPEHAVDLVGLGADVLQEKQLAFGLRRIGRAECGGEQAEAAAVQRAAGAAGAQDADPLLCSGLNEAAGDRGMETAKMDAVGNGEVGCGHRSVKRDETELIEQPGLNAGVVAVSEERFGMAADQVEVKAVEKVIGSVTAAGTNNGCNGWIGESAVQI